MSKRKILAIVIAIGVFITYIIFQMIFNKRGETETTQSPTSSEYESARDDSEIENIDKEETSDIFDIESGDDLSETANYDSESNDLNDKGKRKAIITYIYKLLEEWGIDPTAVKDSQRDMWYLEQGSAKFHIELFKFNKGKEIGEVECVEIGAIIMELPQKSAFTRSAPSRLAPSR